MTTFTLLGIALGLAMDAFAVAVAAGLAISPITGRHVFRLAFHFGLFQFLMPVLGWLAGEQLARHIEGYDHWAAFGLLGFVGGKMLWDSFRVEGEENRSDPTRGLMLVTLSIATSIDALAVGLSLALLSPGDGIWFPAVVIGLVAAALTTVGILFGSRLGPRWETWAERTGGVVLILIGLRILLSHLAS